MPNHTHTHYTSARWKIRAKGETAFLRTWKQFADWTLKQKYGALEAVLLQEEDDPDRFLSFFTWRDLEGVARWRKSQRYRGYLAKLQELCEEMRIRTLRSVLRLEER
jgi:quinol monooxygenase YgiN